MSFQDAIAMARSARPVPTGFSGLESRLHERREARVGEDARLRIAARRWLVLAAAAFALLPADVILRDWAMGYQLAVQGVAVAVLLPMAMLAWAARMVTRPTFAAQVLVRAIAVSNLVVALLLALSVGGVIGALAQVVIAVGCFRALQLLGERGLDASDPRSEFRPIAFRGFLILALIMAFADAQTLMFSALTQGSYLFTDDRTWLIASRAAPTLLAAVIMALNVWGLMRLRTWAMLLNIVANLVIARLALTGTLGVNIYVAASLSLTAAVQLMLPVPILATWWGDSSAGGRGWRFGFAALRFSVAAALVATFLAATAHFGLARVWGWLEDNVAGRVARRGLPGVQIGSLAPDSLKGRLRGGYATSRTGDPKASYGPSLRSDSTLRSMRFDDCDLSGAKAPRLLVRGGSYQRVSLRDANLRDSRFLGAVLDGSDFRGADLRGALFGASSLADVRWEGATCPDGFVATAQTGCDDHLEHGNWVSTQAVERTIEHDWQLCSLMEPDVRACRWLRAQLEGEIVALDRDAVELRWVTGEGPRSRRFERTSGVTWAADTGEILVAVPGLEGETLVYIRVNEWQDAWLGKLSRSEQLRAKVRRLGFGSLLESLFN